jgi:hypothetical protein
MKSHSDLRTAKMSTSLNFARGRYGNLPILAVGMSMIVALSSKAATVTVALSPLAEAGVIGGSGCDFASGFLVGMGVASLLGCIPCGIASGVGAVIHLYAC